MILTSPLNPCAYISNTIHEGRSGALSSLDSRSGVSLARSGG